MPDPARAAVVAAIYAWRAEEHLSLGAIVERLAHDPGHCQPPTDTAGRPRPWTVERLRTILTNPPDTGRSVWGRTHHHRPTPSHAWITSPPGAHPPLIDQATFTRVAATVAVPVRHTYRSQA